MEKKNPKAVNKTKIAKKQSPKTKPKVVKSLNFQEVDHCYYEAKERCAYALNDNNTEYVYEKDRKKTWSVTQKKDGKQLFEGSKAAAIKFLREKTGKEILFVD